MEGISTPAALLNGLAALHVNLGAQPYAQMQNLAGGAHMLPLSSISRILNREMLPVDERQMAAFIQGCGVLNRDREKWMETWRRVKRPASTTHFYTPSLIEDLVSQLRNIDFHRRSEPRQGAIRRRLGLHVPDPAVLGTEAMLQSALDQLAQISSEQLRAYAEAELAKAA
ncbi:hypothetical protein OG361_40765 [Streptomyces sp. NBC_00090]|uniref:hypothetical protein n=1 Tax=Streptomyces sp. NBC_00090 TaxID=2903619 RepID=UPI0032519C59